jgi:hypothetical protein
MNNFAINNNINILRSPDLPINLIAGVVFFVFNPVFALPILVFFSYFSKNINNFWAGTLYSFSFALLFFQQEDYYSPPGNDVGIYINMYNQIDSMSYSVLFERYITNLLHNEFLWFAYTKVISNLTGNNSSIFVFTTYLLIFGLSAYLILLISKLNNTSYILNLFFAIYLNMAFQFSAFHLWRHTIAGLIFLICIIIISSDNPNYFARFGLVVSPLFHNVVLPLVIFFIVYNIFIKSRNNRIIYNIYFIINISILFIITIFMLVYLNVIFEHFFEFSVIESGFTAYKDLTRGKVDFSFLTTPLILLFFLYIITNGKKLLYYEIFVFICFIAISIVSLFIDFIPHIFMGRIRTVFMFVIPLIAAKLIIKSGYYGVLFFCIIVIYRIILFFNPKTIHLLTYVGNENYLNPLYGLLAMIYNMIGIA